ncbi:MAG: cyclic nucleotide-binding domain-containing protein [Pseudomonadota bacterium]
MHQPEPKQVMQQLGLEQMRQLSIFRELSDQVIADLVFRGQVDALPKGESITRIDQDASDFQVVLQGRLAYYKHCDDHYVLTRYFDQGEQLGFDEMIGLVKRNGTDVAVEDSLVLNISSNQFYQLHKNYPGEFGILMLNLALELSREISILEDVIGKGTGWSKVSRKQNS